VTDFIANIANCPLIGEHITRFDDRSWCRNIIDLRLGRTRARLIEKPAVARTHTEHEGKRLHTTDLVFAGLPTSRRAWAVEASADVGWLLAFAGMRPTAVFGWVHGAAGESFGLTMGPIHYSHPIVDFSDGAAVRHFIESCWPNYRHLRKARKLRQVFHQLVQTNMPDQPVEYRLLGAVVVLESLKATYARAKGIPYLKNAFRHPTGPGKNQARARRFEFGELLALMFADVGMQPRLRRLISVRNEIVHFGLSRRPFPRLYKYYGRIQDLIREYLLILLGFRGEYLLFSEPRWRRLLVTKPSRR
jgi:hypothetical protein